MKKYIGKRIISFLIVLVGVSILSFLLIAWSGKDPAEIIAHRGISNPTPEQIEMIRVEMGLDQPLPVRYIQWLSGMFTGELGTSLTTHQPIVKDLHKYPAFFRLVVSLISARILPGAAVKQEKRLSLSSRGETCSTIKSPAIMPMQAISWIIVIHLPPFLERIVPTLQAASRFQ